MTADTLLGLAFRIARVKLIQTQMDLEGENLAKELELEKLRAERERSLAAIEPVVAEPKTPA